MIFYKKNTFCVPTGSLPALLCLAPILALAPLSAQSPTQSPDKRSSVTTPTSPNHTLLLNQKLYKGVRPGQSLEYIKDDKQTFTIKQLADPSYTAFGGKNPWIRAGAKEPSFGFTTAAIWVRISVKNPGPRTRQLYLELSYPLIDKIDLFVDDGTKSKTGELTGRKYGDHLPFKKRDILYRNFVFPLKFEPGQARQIYLRLESGSALNMPLAFWDPISFTEKLDLEQIALGVYYGIMAAMALYNLFLLFSVRDLSYFYYVHYIVGSTLFTLCLNGVAFQYFWPGQAWWSNVSLPFFIFFGAMGVVLFSRTYLNAQETMPRLGMILTFLIRCSFVGIFLSLLIPYAIIIKVATALVLIEVTFMFIAGIRGVLLKYRPAYYYMIAWSLLILGVAVFALKTFNVIPQNFFTNWAMQIGFSLEVILLSLGLADRINTLKQEKERAQKEVLENRVRMADSFSRFVPTQFLNFLGKESVLDIGLGDAEEQEMTVLFCDIRSFASLSEKMSVTENFSFLNAYLKRLSPAIHNHRGFIDKFIGDAIMALFSESPENGLAAAIEMRQILSDYNEHRTRSGHDPIDMGIGLNVGNLMLGTVGSVSRLNTTVIGDTVNLAARIESVTKHYGTPLILSDSVYRGLPDPDKYYLREIDSIRVKGKTNPVVLYESYDADPPAIKEQKLASASIFQLALIHYKAGEFEDARRGFQECLQICPDDSIADLFIKRCEKLLISPPGPGWLGLSRFN